jgi:CheY-like chemotaxis protein
MIAIRRFRIPERKVILQDLPRVLLLERDAVVASHLVIHLEKAGADVITADHAVQALQRLMQFTFSGAMIDYWHGAGDRTTVAERLLHLGVPFVVHALDEPPPAWRAVRVADPNKIVAAVMHLIQTPGTP